MEKIKLKVSGMHCNACEMLIKDILEDQGVDNAIVSMKNGSLEFNYDKSKHDLNKIKKELLKNNYKVIN